MDSGSQEFALVALNRTEISVEAVEICKEMAASPTQMGQLAQLLTQTVAGNMEAILLLIVRAAHAKLHGIDVLASSSIGLNTHLKAMKAAEQQLRAAEVQSGCATAMHENVRRTLNPHVG